ncbi:MAG: ATPase, T2SS/T4P/T4SS family [Erysipelotrichaceae bacterium]|nr:ATPase, T2SS/T4P/T4SS family [Erysipelotrichaceae bacterium]
MEERLLALLKLALKYHASDIHFLVVKNECSIEMRVDGKCRKVKGKAQDYKLVRYLQYLSNLDVGMITKPQTGQFEMDVEGNLLSLRFAIIHELNMINGVLRILNSRINLSVHSLSLLDFQNRYLERILKKPNGLIIFSGPTGSGKTTSVYTLLKHIKGKKIFSVEDPIEVYHDEFVQLSINESTGFDYSKAVEQILRHDPDIIMIGEIREAKAARWAVNAANTGHLVLTTIHTSKASGCISRMKELGVSEDYIYENLICLINQRMMYNVKTRKKQVLFEIMDAREIEYFREHGRNSKDFLSIDRQIEMGIKDGLFT